MPKFQVDWTLSYEGTVEVEADSIIEAEEQVMGMQPTELVLDAFYHDISAYYGRELNEEEEE